MLAATLSPTYGIYSGFEHCENVPLREGSEEYLDSEKYEVEAAAARRPAAAAGRAAERDPPREPRAPARRQPRSSSRRRASTLIAYAKRTDDNVVIVVVNLDPFETREGLAVLPAAIGLPPAFRCATC